MPNSIDFYKGIFLHVIPVCITVPFSWCDKSGDNTDNVLFGVRSMFYRGKKYHLYQSYRRCHKLMYFFDRLSLKKAVIKSFAIFIGKNTCVGVTY